MSEYSILMFILMVLVYIAWQITEINFKIK